MVQINFARKEINCKVVYYGPGLSGKTTNLEVVHQKTPETNKGDLTSISTDGDRTLFFDFMPLDLGMIAGMKTKFHLYTVPGQVYYNSTRKLVLLGADGILFIADSSPGRLDDNFQSLENLRENMAEMGRDLNKIPLVIQYNKRDVPNAIPVAELEAKLNPNGLPFMEASAKTGEGVFQTLKAISALVLEDINSNEKRLVPGKVARKPLAVRPTSTATDTQNQGLLPQPDASSVLRPAKVKTEGGTLTAVASAPARTAALSRTTAIAPVESVESRARVARPRPQPAPGPATTARASSSAPVRRPAASKEPAAAPAAVAERVSSARLFVFIGLGILTAAAAAVAAAKFLLNV